MISVVCEELNSNSICNLYKSGSVEQKGNHYELVRFSVCSASHTPYLVVSKNMFSYGL